MLDRLVQVFESWIQWALHRADPNSSAVRRSGRMSPDAPSPCSTRSRARTTSAAGKWSGGRSSARSSSTNAEVGATAQGDPPHSGSCAPRPDGIGSRRLAGHRRFTRRARAHCGLAGTATLNGEIFCSLAEAAVLVEQWRREYNTVRPHSACGGFPPAPEAIKPSPWFLRMPVLHGSPQVLELT